MNIASHPVVASLTPVFILIGLGYLAGRLQWIRDAAVKDLSNLVFLLLIPALLFRTMSSVHFEELDLRPIGAYFLAALSLLAVSIAWRGFNRGSVVLALAGTFSNMVMLGITLVELAYGKSAQVTVLTLVSVHALILLTTGSIVLELAVAREARAGCAARAARAAPRRGRPSRARSSTRFPCPSCAACCSRRAASRCPRWWTGRCNCWAAPSARSRWCWWA
ncbi:AEC family transporter [Hydrogenophaga sp. UC242_53]|uniref:AEC family transporter n=1 Tax=Hydrogenophaga sp. UC242_53 TaxID=3350170 RepID=UPI0036D28289